MDKDRSSSFEVSSVRRPANSQKGKLEVSSVSASKTRHTDTRPNNRRGSNSLKNTTSSRQTNSFEVSSVVSSRNVSPVQRASANNSAGHVKPQATINTAEKSRTHEPVSGVQNNSNSAISANNFEISETRLNRQQQLKRQEELAELQRRRQRIEQQRRIEAEKRKKLEDDLSPFTYSNKPRNYFVNLMLTTFKMLVIAVLIIGLSGIGFVLGMAKSYLETVPQLDTSLVSGQDQSTILYDINGDSLGSLYNLENREWANIEEIPLNLQNAVIAIEDVRFRRHIGIDVKRIGSSLLSNLSSGSVQGGSTITQQLIKNTMLSFEQTYKRKIQEASLAIELEKTYTKDQILESYLNTIFMGGSCYGMKTAARNYFGKNLSDLTLRECACLAGMIQNPSRYNPRSNYYTRSNPARTDNRTNLVLYEMYENGFISEEQYLAAKTDSFKVLEENPYSNASNIVYFTDYVLDSVVDQLIDLRGLKSSPQTRSALRNEIRTSGYKIYTTVDVEKQKTVEKAVYNFDGYPSMKYSTDSYTVSGRNPDGTVIRLTQPQTAVVIMDYHNGYIVAMVGGRQAPTGSLEYNRSYQSTMPVGSSIKPLAVYGPAIENGSGAGTVYYNFAQKIDGWDSELGYPMNNTRTYPGWMTMRTAIVASYNVTAAQALMYDVGLDQAYAQLVKLGVNEEHISKTGSGLALGSSGITPLEMAGAFSAIANMGVYNEPIAFTKIENSNGDTVLDMLSRQDTHEAFSRSTSWQLIDLLHSVASGTRAVVPGQTTYGKTGTNSEMRGVYFAGFTGYYVGTVWIGSDAYKPLVDDAQGGRYAAPLFSTVMQKLHSGLPDKPATDVLPEDVGVTQVTYCSASGKLATEHCPKTHTEYGCRDKMQLCDIHRTVKICSESGCIANENCPNDGVIEKAAVTVPEKGALNFMYKTYRSTFNSCIGTPNAYSTCTIH